MGFGQELPLLRGKDAFLLGESTCCDATTENGFVPVGRAQEEDA